MTDSPLVLLPGLTDDISMWDHQCRYLTDVCDPTPVDLLEQTTVSEGAQRVLDTLSGSFALAGFSMGGYVAFEILRRAPERVTHLVLIDTSARPDDEQRRAARLQRIGRAESGDYEALISELVPNVVHASRREDKGLLESIETMALRVGPQAYVRQEHTCMSRPDSRNSLAAIKCPTLIICGREDSITPPMLSSEMAAGIEHSKLVWLDQCNHYAPMERPSATTALLQLFLSYG